MRALLILTSLCGFTTLSASQSGNPVEQELALLRARSDVAFATRDGWIVVTEADGLTIWSFTPATHPANSAYVKRWFYQKDGAWYVEMRAQCGASKLACDTL